MSTIEQDKTRERIVEAAGEIFAEKGFDAATVREICHAAGANIAAVNYHFGDKQKLYVEAVVRAHRWRMARAALPEWTEETSADQKLADFITTFVRRVRTGPGDTWHTRLMMREIMHPSGACAELARSSIRPQFEILQSVLRELAPPGMPAEKLHLLGFSIVGQCLFYHVADAVIRNLIDEEEYETYDIEKLAGHIVAFSRAGLKSLETSQPGGAKGAAR